MLPPQRLAPPLALAFLMAWGVLTLWVRARWAQSALEAGLFLLAAAVFALARPRWNWRLAPLLFAAGWPLVQAAAGWTVYRQATLEASLFWTAAACAHLAAGFVFADRDMTGRFRRGMAWFGAGLAALATLQLYTSGGRVSWLFDSGYRDNVLGPFVYRNNYAAFIALLLPLALVEAFRPSRLRGWFLAGAALMAASVAASGSRAGAALVLAEVLAVGWLCRRGTRANSTMLRLIVLSAVLAGVAGGGFLWQRLQEKDPYGLRRTYLEASLAMVRDRPWTGFGMGAWPHVYPAYALRDNGMFANHAHCDWAEWAAEGGLPFVAAAALLAAGLLPRALRSVWGIGLAAVSLHALVDYPFARLGQAVWWFVLAALVCAPAGQNDAHGANQDVQVEPE